MHEETIDPKAATCLATLVDHAMVTPFYLAGGTALALHIGHRRSIDLDWFTRDAFDATALTHTLQRVGRFTLNERTVGTLHGTLDGTRVTFLQYPYPLLERRRTFRGAHIAHPLDIGCMKLDAIATRSTKKDFVDLYFLLQTIPLQKILRTFARKYRSVNYNLEHVLKSLVYFADARPDPLPDMLVPFSWNDLERTLEREVRNLKSV